MEKSNFFVLVNSSIVDARMGAASCGDSVAELRRSIRRSNNEIWSLTVLAPTANFLRLCSDSLSRGWLSARSSDPPSRCEYESISFLASLIWRDASVFRLSRNMLLFFCSKSFESQASNSILVCCTFWTRLLLGER